MEKSKYLNTGSTLLNLACSGKYNGGFIKGKYYYLVGDSTSGKTFLSLTCLAEASNNKNFDDYRFIYDNSEDGALMDIAKFFGQKVKDRMEPPAFEDDEPSFSSSIEEFYYNLDDAFKEGKPFIYVLDSMDSLTSKQEDDKFDEAKIAYRKGKTAAGNYAGTDKAKKNSQNIKRLLKPLKKSGSILIIISQTRDALGNSFSSKTRSGGHSLRFYTTLEIWSSVKKYITKTIRNKKRQIGIICKLKIKKNRLNGAIQECEIPIYRTYGIDDIGACVDYLIDEKHWTKSGQSIKAPEYKFKGSYKSLIKLIESKPRHMKNLKRIVNKVWQDIEKACSLNRKKRYE